MLCKLFNKYRYVISHTVHISTKEHNTYHVKFPFPCLLFDMETGYHPKAQNYILCYERLFYNHVLIYIRSAIIVTILLRFCQHYLVKCRKSTSKGRRKPGGNAVVHRPFLSTNV